MSIRRAVRGPALLAIASAAIAVALAGCGGGGGSDVTVYGTAIDYDGGKYVLNDATVSARYWSAPTTEIAQTTANSSGKYVLSLPSEASGKSLILVASQASTSKRASRVIGDLASSGRSEVYLDNYTTVATEYLMSKVTASTAITGPPVETIISEIRKMNSIADVSLVPGVVIPATMGGGITDATVTTALNTDTINKAVQSIAGDPDIQKAKRFAEMTREALWALGVNGQSTAESLATAGIDQYNAIKAATKSLRDVATRVKIVIQALWAGGGSGANEWDTLDGQIPGTYDYYSDSNGVHLLNRTGDAPDGKSWIVTSKLDDTSKNSVLKITPANKIDTFVIKIEAGSYTFTVTNPDMPTMLWSGTMVGSKDNEGYTNKVTLNMTATDPGLTEQFKLNGVLTGTHVSGQPKDAYHDLHVTGSLSTQIVSGSLGDATIEWQNDVKTNGLDVKLLKATDFTFTTKIDPSLKVTMNSGSITFDAADPTNGLKYATPNTATLTGSIVGDKHSTSMTNGKIVFERTGVHAIDGVSEDSKSVYLAVQLKSISGSATFKSPTLTFSGSLDGTFTYLPVPLNLGDLLRIVRTGHAPSDWADPWPVSKFPNFSLGFKGDITPVIGASGGLDVVLSASPTAGAGTKPQVALTFNKFYYGDETMTGQMSVTFGASGGNVVWDAPTAAAHFTHSPSGYYLTMSGTSLDTFTGGIYN